MCNAYQNEQEEKRRETKTGKDGGDNGGRHGLGRSEHVLDLGLGGERARLRLGLLGGVRKQLQIDLAEAPLNRIVDERVRDDEIERVDAARLTEALGLCGEVNVGLVGLARPRRCLGQEEDLVARLDVRETHERLVRL